MMKKRFVAMAMTAVPVGEAEARLVAVTAAAETPVRPAVPQAAICRS